MNDSQFTWWLNGYVEIANGARPDETQWAIIKDHLALVFNKVTPNRLPTYCAKTDPTLPAWDGRVCGQLPFMIPTGDLIGFFSQNVSC